uniref:Uncharacterized protein n=1 Tax=Oryza meridionalis TaxID=40149 RepID=A0A0E0FCX2_9ORYZ
MAASAPTGGADPAMVLVASLPCQILKIAFIAVIGTQKLQLPRQEIKMPGMGAFVILNTIEVVHGAALGTMASLVLE